MIDKKIKNERLNAFSGCSFMLFIYTSMVFLGGFFIEAEGVWVASGICSFILLALTVGSFTAVDYSDLQELEKAPEPEVKDKPKEE